VDTGQYRARTPVHAGLPDVDTNRLITVTDLAISGNDIFAGTDGAGVWRRPLSEMP